MTDGSLAASDKSATDGKPLGAALLRGLFRHCYWECPVTEGNATVDGPRRYRSRAASWLLPAAQNTLSALLYIAHSTAICAPGLVCGD